MFLALAAFAAVSILRLALFFTGRAPEGTDFMIVHFLALVTVVFFTGQRMLADEPRTGFPGLVRSGFRNAAVYALLTGLFLWVFYATIDTTEFPRKIDERVAAVMEQGRSETEARAGLEAMFNPFNYASISFFALLAVGAFNALLIAMVHHKLLRRLR